MNPTEDEDLINFDEDFMRFDEEDTSEFDEEFELFKAKINLDLYKKEPKVEEKQNHIPEWQMKKEIEEVLAMIRVESSPPSEQSSYASFEGLPALKYKFKKRFSNDVPIRNFYSRQVNLPQGGLNLNKKKIKKLKKQFDEKVLVDKMISFCERETQKINLQRIAQQCQGDEDRLREIRAERTFEKEVKELESLMDRIENELVQLKTSQGSYFEDLEPLIPPRMPEDS